MLFVIIVAEQGQRAAGRGMRGGQQRGIERWRVWVGWRGRTCYIDMGCRDAADEPGGD